MEPRFIFLQLSATWALPSTRISLFSSTCQIWYLELRRISSIRHYLSQDALKTLISALACPESITAIPYTLAVLSSSFTNFKKVQNNAARLTCLISLIIYLPSFKLFTGFLLNKIEYKLLLLAFESVNNDGPSYLFDPLKFYIPSRQLRSSADSRLLHFV